MILIAIQIDLGGRHKVGGWYELHTLIGKQERERKIVDRKKKMREEKKKWLI